MNWPLVTVITIRPRHDHKLDVIITTSTLNAEKNLTRRFETLPELRGWLIEYCQLNITGELTTKILLPGRIWPVCKRLKISVLHFEDLPWYF
jgi:hypothetical protein